MTWRMNHSAASQSNYGLWITPLNIANMGWEEFAEDQTPTVSSEDLPGAALPTALLNWHARVFVGRELPISVAGGGAER